MQEILTCVFPLPVCPYAKQVAIPLSNMVSTNGRAVNLECKKKIAYKKMKHLKLPLPQGQHKARNDRTGSVL